MPETLLETTATETYQPFIETPADQDPVTLRRQMGEQGYIFLRHLVPAEAVLNVRRQALELCREAGWLDPNADLMDGVVAPGQKPTMEGQPDYQVMYRKLIHTPDFHAFPLHPELMRVAGMLLDGEVLVHPRRIGRVTFPHLLSATTPPHQDHFYIRGTVDTYSCWIPLGAVPIELGGLAILPGSQQGGFLDHNVNHQGAVGGRGVPLPDGPLTWHISEFEVGDVLFFTSYTIHKAMPNLTTNRLRVSTDNRYQRPAEAIDPGSLRPHLDLY